MMVRANKRLPSSVSVTKSALDSATSSLQELPAKPKESWSLREAVSVLQETISATLSKGYSYEEVAKMLSAKGVEISASSLKSYLSAAKRQKGSPAASTRKTGRRSKKVDADVNLNSSATSVKSKSASKKADASTSDSTQVELPAEKPTRRKTKTATAAPRKSAAKAKPAAKTTTKTVSKSSASRPASRSRQKSS